MPEESTDPVAQILALAAADREAATTACYRHFDRGHRPSDDTATRLVALTGQNVASTGSLIASLRHADNLLGVVTAQALAERGSHAAPALTQALQDLPLPADEDATTWWQDETVKYRLIHALAAIGPAAAPAIPILTAISRDDHAYRDSRWIAQQALTAIRPNRGKFR